MSGVPVTIHYLSNARLSQAEAAPPPRPDDERTAVSRAARSSQRAPIVDVPPRRDDGDQTGWLLTFSDLVLQLFAFTIISLAFAPQAGSVTRTPSAVVGIAAPVAAAVETVASADTAPPP